MKKNMFKKVTASITSIIALTTMAIPTGSCAYDSNHKNTAPAYQFTTSTVQANVDVKKDIVMFNSEAKPIFSPNITYTYNITTAAATDATISTVDGSNNPVVLTVRPGIMDAIIGIDDCGDNIVTPDSNGDPVDTSIMTGDSTTKTGTITFNSDGTTTKKSNKEDSLTNLKVDTDYKFTQKMSITVDASKIYDIDNDGVQDNGPGVYRYKITDVTTAETYAAAGVTDGGGKNNIYLDVYTKYNDSSTGLVVYGYVLLRETNDDGNASVTYNQEIATDTIKTEGYVTTSEGDDNNDGSVLPSDLKSDVYKTYNLIIKKQVSGDLADRMNEFPFEISLSNATVTTTQDFGLNNGEGIHSTQHLTSGAWNSADVTIANLDFNLKHNEIINIIGVPANTKVMVKETNNTNDIYSVSMIGNNFSKNVKTNDDPALKTSVNVANGKQAILGEGFDINTSTQADTLTVVNTLSDVSVTGLILSVAPFILLTVAGIVLLAVFMHNKRKNKSDSMI